MIDGGPSPTGPVGAPSVASTAMSRRVSEECHGLCAEAVRRAIMRLKAASQERPRARSLGVDHAEDMHGVRPARWSPDVLPTFLGALLPPSAPHGRTTVEAMDRDVLPGFEQAIEEDISRQGSSLQAVAVAATAPGSAGVQNSSHDASDKAMAVDSTAAVTRRPPTLKRGTAIPQPFASRPDRAQGTWMRLIRVLAGVLAIVLLSLYLATDLLRAPGCTDHTGAESRSQKDMNRHHKP